MSDRFTGHVTEHDEQLPEAGEVISMVMAQRDEARLMLEVALRHNRELEAENARLQRVKAANEEILFHARFHPSNEIADLKAENARLRGLIKDSIERDGGLITYCPFCKAHHLFDREHTTCPAFDEWGRVK